MSSQSASLPTIPARLTVSGFAAATDRSVAEVQAVLEDRFEPFGEEDMIDPDVSVALAQALGLKINIEPRDLALETLYQLESRGDDEHEELTGRAERLVAGVLEHREGLDHEIESASDHWSVARMPVIDRSILRLGLFELRYESGIPTAVVIAEAVRLARTYSTERSGSFVNGVLASLARSAPP